jgi:hypothetical protein
LAEGTWVTCDYDFHALRSDQIGKGPYSGSYVNLAVKDGEIVQMSGYLEHREFWRQMWLPFLKWMSTNYRKDAAVMYEGDHTPSIRLPSSYARLTPESIRLWEQHSREYVESLQATAPAQTAPPSAPASGEPDQREAGKCSDGARSHLELTRADGRISVRFEIHRSPVGDSWLIRLRHHSPGAPVVPPWPNAFVFFNGTRVASDSGVLAVQVFFRELDGWDGFGAYAVDEQTGQTCRAADWIN